MNQTQQRGQQEKDLQLRERQHIDRMRAEESVRNEAREIRQAETDQRRKEQERLAALQQQKMAAVRSWLDEGKSAVEIEILTRTIFG